MVSTGDNEGDVSLTWEAPHEDGNQGGAVEEYEIRHHDAVITGVNWLSATLVTNPPDPLPPGQEHTFTVGALTPGKLYYFAIKSADEVPNWSGISNNSYVTTAAESGGGTGSPHRFWGKVTNAAGVPAAEVQVTV